MIFDKNENLKFYEIYHLIIRQKCDIIIKNKEIYINNYLTELDLYSKQNRTYI